MSSLSVSSGENSAAETSPLPSLSLPKGGGAIRDIGEKFAVNACSGTGSITIPVPVSPSRSGFGPTLSLAYNSGAGNGPFGFGWRLSLPSITRKTDKGLPQYLDASESDVFILSDAEDLVPLLDAKQVRARTTRVLHGATYEVAWYRPRIEQGFARIERWTAAGTSQSHWRCITRDNVTTLYGLDANSRIADPADSNKIFSYLPSLTFDDNGNVTRYSYIAEDDRAVDTAAAHEANRTSTSRAVQRYIKSIQYGNVQPYWPDWSATGAATPLPSAFCFQLVFDYGDHSTASPTPVPDQPWPVRPDPFSRGRACFEVRTYRRCSRILTFHNFPEVTGVGANCLVRSLDFAFSDQLSPTDPANPIYTFLASITQSGYRRQEGGGYLQASMPPIEFAYSVPQVQSEVSTLEGEDGTANLPAGIQGGDYRWIDLDGEGLTGILADLNGAWVYKRNVSATPQPQFVPLETLATLPSRTTLDASQRLMDLSADGRLDVVALAEPDAGYFERTENWTWASLERFAALPQVDWTNRNVTFVDLTGDGLADVLLTEDGLFTLWPSLGAQGFDAPLQVRTPWDEEQGPKVVLADGTETIFLADMTGDGLSDLVRVRNGEVSYWPNYGYGRFGARVAMDASPRFTDQERYDPTRLRLADIDGSGTADLLYVGDRGVSVCFNQSGNAWAQPQTLAVFPSNDPESRVDVVDLFGTGTQCLVWSSPQPFAASAPLRYVDLMGGTKPHLLINVRNNLGAETRITYAPSTQFYVADRLAGEPWITRLFFPVQVVERVEIFDWIGRSRCVTRYAYHHGYFDGVEREFRGFGRVEQWDTDEHRDDTSFPASGSTNWDSESFVPPVMTRTWFHTGAFVEAGTVSRQYASEYWPEAMQLPNSVVPSGLDSNDFREAYRALKGMTLRTEVYGQDGSVDAVNPYSVVDTNYSVTLLQPSGPNPHACFFTHARETLTFQYERAASDPRVTHAVTLELDAFGDELRSVSVGYPRRPGYAAPEPTLASAFQTMLAYDQNRLRISATQNAFTNDLADPTTLPDAHRTPLASETIKAEFTASPPASPTAPFAFADLDALWTTLWSGAHDVAYEDVPPSDVDGAGGPSVPTRRIVSHTRTLYRSDDLTALLPLGQLQSGARTGETYRLAFTPTLISAIFGALVPPATLTEGGYTQPGGDPNWWIPSGRMYYSAGAADTPAQELANAQAHFFLPRRYIDQFGAISVVAYDAYDLLGTLATDAVGNTTAATNDYVTLSPALITDPNGNRAQAAFDALGYVVGTAVMGKTTESLGDSLSGFTTDLTQAQIAAHLADPFADAATLLGNATCRYVYDYFAYYRSASDPQPQPCLACSLERVTHVSDLGSGQTTLFRHTFSYADGFAREIQKKTQAADGPLVAGGSTVSPRWVGSGWTIYNNKGKPVRTYEPFFSATQGFEFANAVGVSTVLLYDPPGRLVATFHPDNTWEKTVFDAWRRDLWDGNDTVLIADPRTDSDVGPYFARLLGTGTFTSWYNLRIGGTYGSDPGDQIAQRDAAKKAALHAATPGTRHFDSLARECLTVADDGGGGRFPLRTAYDILGRTLALIDAAGRRAVEFCLRDSSAPYILGYDLTGATIYENSIDAGARRHIANIAAQPLRRWDARNQAFRFRYDLLRRPTHVYVSTGGAAEVLIERDVYGEGQAAVNLCTRLFRQYHEAGLSSYEQYDYTGNLVQSARQPALTYTSSPDWSAIANITATSALDAATATLLVKADRFVETKRYDALNRTIQQVTAHTTGMKPNVLQPAYDEAGLPTTLDVWTQQATAPSGLLDAGTASFRAVTGIAYNARAQRIEVDLGNQTVSTYTYDPQTFRIVNLTSTRPSTFAANARVVQDLDYAYDPVGNVTRLRDSADTHDVIYFNNQRVDPTNDYTYDPLYRLIAATGREHLGQTGGALNAPAQVTSDDSFRMALPQPGDGNAMGGYTETYTYDAPGNLQRVVHAASSGAWTRSYSYALASQIVAADSGNRLTTSSLPGDPAGGPYTAAYTYDAHGNMLSMPQLPALTWDEYDRLRSSTRQVFTTGTPQTTYYNYAAGGERMRKITNNQAAAEQTPAAMRERIYLGAVEIYREFAADGVTVTLQRETLHATLEPHRVVSVETRTIGSDDGAANLTRYQFANHLESAILELDDQSQIITYEEYFPFGSTSYQAVRSQTDTPKRYRYTAKERDTESDLYYNSARYYIPWLGRWTSCDPAGMIDGTVPYAYVRNNPVRLFDPTGTQSAAPDDNKTTVTVTYKAGPDEQTYAPPDDPNDASKGTTLGIPPLASETGPPNPPFANQAQSWSNMFSPVRGIPNSAQYWYPTLDVDVNTNAQAGGGGGVTNYSFNELLSARLNLPQASFSGGKWLVSSQVGALASAGPQGQTGAPQTSLLTAGGTAAVGVSSSNLAFALSGQLTYSSSMGGSATTAGAAVNPNQTAGTAGSVTGIAQWNADDRNTLIANPVVGGGSTGSFLNTQSYGSYSSVGGIVAWQHLVGDTADKNSLNLEAGYSHTWATPLTPGESTGEDRAFVGVGFSHTGSNYVVSGNIDAFAGVPSGGTQNPFGASVLATVTVGFRLPLFTPAPATK